MRAPIDLLTVCITVCMENLDMEVREREGEKEGGIDFETVFITADVVTSSEKNVSRPFAVLVLMELTKINGC